MIEYLTTKEVAYLLRVRDRKIYDLVSTRSIPIKKITGKLLFPKAEMEAWMRKGSGDAVPPRGEVANAPALPAIVTGGHDPLLEWALRRSGSGLATFLDGALDGLDRAETGLCLAAGLHIPEENDGWNVGSVRGRFADRPWVLVEFALRRRGLIVGPSVATVPRTLRAVGRLLFQRRQAKAGSELILERLLAREGLSASDLILADGRERTENDLALAIAGGRAEIGLGIEAAARQFGLRFVPLIEERFDLLVERRAWFDPPFQAFVAFCASAEFRARAEDLGGYDVSGFGRVHFNGA